MCINRKSFILLRSIHIATMCLYHLEELGWKHKGKIAAIRPKYDQAFFSCSEIYNLERISSNKTCCLSNEQLLKELFLDPLLSSYAILIIYDVDRRYVWTDTVLALLKKILRKRPTLKVVLVSNTKEGHFFFDYFNTRDCHRSDQITTAILSVDDADIKQSIFYLKNPCADYITKSIETLRNINEKFPFDGDLLVYLADEDEINQAIDLLKDYVNKGHIKNINYFKVLHQSNEQSIFFSKLPAKRNVIFTLDLSQHSVNQDRICAVIDCGFTQIDWFEAGTNKSHKIIVPVSKCTADMRSNWRSQYRKAKVFRLYSKNDFIMLPETSVAKMRRTDLCGVILYLKTLAVDNILRFDFPSPPPAKNVLSALETLNALDAIDDQGRLTNPIGFFMSDLPFCPHLSKVLFNSVKFNCTEEILTIAAMLQVVDSIFIVTSNYMADSHKQVAKRAFEVSEGDLITLLNVYTAFVANNKSKEFCRKYYLNYRGLIWASNLRNYFANLLTNKYNMPPNSCQGNIESVLKCIVSGYFINVAYLDSSGVYKDLRSKYHLYIDRLSSLYTQPQPKYIIYCTLYENTKTIMRNLTVIREEWLSEIAPHYYEIK